MYAEIWWRNTLGRLTAPKLRFTKYNNNNNNNNNNLVCLTAYSAAHNIGQSVNQQGDSE